MLFFNTAGPVNTDDHYCIDPLMRFDTKEILRLIEEKKYFVLYAPRHSGKTSCLLALADYLNKNGTYNCLYLNIESAYAAQKDPGMAMKSILSELSSRARDFLGDTFPETIASEILKEKGPNLALNELLTLWAKNSSKPIVLFFDEIDSVEGNLLISLLRQIRAGYDKRPHLFPHSILFCGIEDLQYKKILETEKGVITGGSIFNIKGKSLRLKNFDKDEIKYLFMQYSNDTKVKIEEEVFTRLWELTNGLPWIVNALAYEICFEMIPRKKDIEKIKLKDVEEAAENLIQRREIHLKNLIDKLNEERVKKIICPMLIGAGFPDDVTEEDLRYVYYLGLINMNTGEVDIANEIYREVIPRALIYPTQLLIRYNLSWYMEEDGSLNIRKILRLFQLFYKKHYEQWIKRFSYKKAGASLLIQAFLQRIIDGGGRIERIYGLGREYITLIIQWPYRDKNQNIVIDIRYIGDSLDDPVQTGTECLLAFLKSKSIASGHLIIFLQSGDESREQNVVSSKIDDTEIDVWQV
ncbi:MAG: ATP-binding protein [Spirochaetales bacterium]|nr:ATP-binding protein [Spirochaetales bacterium]